MQGTIRRGQSSNLNARQAVRELREQLEQPDVELVLFFCSSEYDLAEVADELKRQFAEVEVVGCTTAGEIGPLGYIEHSICGASFPRKTFAAVTAVISDIKHFDFSEGQQHVQSLLQRLESQSARAATGNTFAFMMIDGLSGREELLTRSLQSAFGNIPMIGGSAGDGLDFSNTNVYFEGTFRSNAAVIALVSTCRPFRIFKTQHFVPMEERLVVTEADVPNRIVREINGLPASQEYARAVGIDPEKLEPTSFAGSPVVVLIDGSNYVRSIQKANSDGSLTFFCAIEEGLVLRVAHGVDLLPNMNETFRKIEAEIGTPDLVIGCDCVLRKIEVFNDGLDVDVGNTFRRFNTIGLSTYGEQYCGVHINQTLTGIAIGSLDQEGDGD